MKLLSLLILRKRTFSFVAVVVALAVLFSFVTSGIILSFAADNSELYDFEKSGVTYIPKVQTKTYTTETKCSATVTTDKAATGTHSLHITTASGAAEAQYFFFGSSFNPQAGKWMNVKALVPQASGTDIAALFYKQENGQIKISDYYYFSQTSDPTDGVRSRNTWVNMSLQVPSGVSLREVGIYLTSFGSANDNADIYIDSYSVTDKAVDTDRYVDMDSADVRRSFEGGGGSDYIDRVQTISWTTESNYVSAVTNEHASKGKKSLCISTKSGAAKGQYFYLKTNTFMPTTGKWMNLKVFVSENKGPDYLSLFYKQSNGVISTGDLYYFADDISNPVTTDEIRKKNEWVTVSLFVPETANVTYCGVYTGTFGSSNDTACFYIDDFTVTDSALDTIRYLDLNNPGVKSGFESG